MQDLTANPQTPTPQGGGAKRGRETSRVRAPMPYPLIPEPQTFTPPPHATSTPIPSTIPTTLNPNPKHETTEGREANRMRRPNALPPISHPSTPHLTLTSPKRSPLSSLNYPSRQTLTPNTKHQREEEQSAAEKQAASDAPMPTVGLLSNHRSTHRGPQVCAPFKTVRPPKAVTIKAVATCKAVTPLKAADADRGRNIPESVPCLCSGSHRFYASHSISTLTYHKSRPNIA